MKFKFKRITSIIKLFKLFDKLFPEYNIQFSKNYIQIEFTNLNTKEKFIELYGFCPNEMNRFIFNEYIDILDLKKFNIFKQKFLDILIDD